MSSSLGQQNYTGSIVICLAAFRWNWEFQKDFNQLPRAWNIHNTLYSQHMYTHKGFHIRRGQTGGKRNNSVDISFWLDSRRLEYYLSTSFNALCRKYTWNTNPGSWLRISSTFPLKTGWWLLWVVQSLVIFPLHTHKFTWRPPSPVCIIILVLSTTRRTGENPDQRTEWFTIASIIHISFV